jgi:GxxExxY protein
MDSGKPTLETTLAHRVVGAAMKVHRELGCGFLESVYRNALSIELRYLRISFEIHPVLPVFYQGEEVGIFQADLIVEGQLIVELKALESLNSIHSLQLINYLTAAQIEDGLLLNFGAKSLEFRTKKRTRPETPSFALNPLP